MQPGMVQKVVIINRKDCCGDRLKSLEVRVGPNEVTNAEKGLISRNTICGMIAGPGKDGEIAVISCNPPIEGKYITLQTLDATVTHINFAEVWGFGNSSGTCKYN